MATLTQRIKHKKTERRKKFQENAVCYLHQPLHLWQETKLLYILNADISWFHSSLSFTPFSIKNVCESLCQQSFGDTWWAWYSHLSSALTLCSVKNFIQNLHWNIFILSKFSSLLCFTSAWVVLQTTVSKLCSSLEILLEKKRTLIFIAAVWRRAAARLKNWSTVHLQNICLSKIVSFFLFGVVLHMALKLEGGWVQGT